MGGENLKKVDESKNNDNIAVASDKPQLEAQLEKIDPSKRFSKREIICQSQQGRIYAANDLQTGEYAVIKESWKQLVEKKITRDAKSTMEDFFEEIRILTKLSEMPECHPSMFTFLYVCIDYRCIVFVCCFCICFEYK